MHCELIRIIYEMAFVSTLHISSIASYSMYFLQFILKISHFNNMKTIFEAQ